MVIKTDMDTWNRIESDIISLYLVTDRNYFVRTKNAEGIILQ